MDLPPGLDSRPLRVGIFTNVLEHRPSGIGWHVIHLLKALSEVDTKNQYFLIYRTQCWNSSLGHQFSPISSNFRHVPVAVPDLFYKRYFRVFDRWVLPRVIRRLRLDVFHGPNHYLPRKTTVPQVVTYHDIAQAVLSVGEEGVRHQVAVQNCLNRADAVIALSKCTMADLTKVGKLPLGKYIIYQGGNHEGENAQNSNCIDSVRREFRLTERYVLFVGSVVERKNLPTLIRVFARVQASIGGHLQLVIAGADDTPEAHRVRAACTANGVGDHVVFTGYVSNEQLTGLYGGASAFVLASHYEGFGMILLEAMAAGVPIVCTAAGALPEVLGDAGILVPPGDEEAMAEAVLRVLRSPEVAADLVVRGHARRKAFSWRKMAEETLAVYREVAADHLTGSDRPRP
ncbi:glycosyltransferase family 1 protein [Limnoglobus roseus]|uniref:Glycosyltransferase family 1 protein n=2 Tax=Limnoglobus roseus TaxID=2598579 RepID=A0A5C1AC02_9BACT|nr:glycosyltransferase family 1 protein [Limnoglobus roseus]